MSDLPESIWADPPDIFDDMSIWYNYPTEGQTKYVRADTVQVLIDAAREAALREVQALAMRAAEAVLAEFKDSQKQGWTFRQAHIENAVAQTIALIRKGDQP